MNNLGLSVGSAYVHFIGPLYGTGQQRGPRLRCPLILLLAIAKKCVPPGIAPMRSVNWRPRPSKGGEL